MSGSSLVSAVLELRHLEQEAKDGDVDRSDVVDRLGFDDEDKIDCAKGTGMALLHLPVKTSMDLAWFALTPLLTAAIVFYGFTFGAFLAFVAARIGIWAYDSALLYRGKDSDDLAYNSSTLSTLMGTFPYRGNRIIGPGATVALDIAIVLPFSGLLGLGQLGILGHAVEASAVAHALLTLVTRASLNTVCAWEMASGADEVVVERTAAGARRIRRVLADARDVVLEAPALVKRFVSTMDGPPDAGYATASARQPAAAG